MRGQKIALGSTRLLGELGLEEGAAHLPLADWKPGQDGVVADRLGGAISDACQALAWDTVKVTAGGGWPGSMSWASGRSC